MNFPGYDLVAFNPARKISCRIHVKSRWATDYDEERGRAPYNGSKNFAEVREFFGGRCC
jgi:hypothetical protein